MTAKRKAAKKKVAKKKSSSRRKSTKVGKIAGAPNPDYLNAIAYLVSSEENETKLMVASTMGLISK